MPEDKWRYKTLNLKNSLLILFMYQRFRLNFKIKGPILAQLLFFEGAGTISKTTNWKGANNL
jgi:hypothetical protein